jgi:hypothetical protein
VDSDFERVLLERVDRFLASKPGFSHLLEFEASFGRFYFEHSSERTTALEATLPHELAIPEQMATPVGKEIRRLTEQQLPAVGRLFFESMLERMSFTICEPMTPHFRQFYITLDEFMEYLREQRSLYRERFGE